MCIKVYAVVRSPSFHTQVVALYESEETATKVAANLNERFKKGTRHQVIPMQVLCASPDRTKSGHGRSTEEGKET